MKTYPLADIPTAAETGGATYQGRRSLFRAVATGERRPPKAGEWYLSGAIVEAYRAPNDLSQVHVMARLVKVRTIPSREEVIEIERNKS